MRLKYILFAIFITCCSGAPFYRVKDSPKKRFPDAIIVGVKKAGTRALLEFLRLNPLIKAPGPEVHFFDKNFDNGLDWYRERMPETRLNQLTIEKSPAYFHSKSAPERIRALDPKMKIIIVVRDPITRAISDYTQASSKKKRQGMMPTFEEMATGDCAPWLKANCTNKVHGINAQWGAIRIGVYHKHFKRWLDNFPMEQIHIVDGENLIRNPAKEVSDTEKFLGLEPVVKADDFAVDPQKHFPCLRQEDNSLHCLGKTKGRHHPDVSPNVIQQLRDYYAPENEIFYRMINKRYNWD